MKFFQNIIIYIFVLGNLLFTQEIYTRGVLYPVEASFCMDECAQYFIESEPGYPEGFIMDQHGSHNLNSYVMQEVELWGEEYFCIECGAINVSEINLLVDECLDLSNLDFGMCDMYLGWAWVGDDCQDFSGCGYIQDGIDYSNSFYNSYSECYYQCSCPEGWVDCFIDPCEMENCPSYPNAECIANYCGGCNAEWFVNGEQVFCEDNLTCNEIEEQYAELHGSTYSTCNQDEDCQAVWGDCGVGLGGCHYSVNIDDYNQDGVNNLVDLWNIEDCMEWVCDCMPLPNAICNNNECDLTYCSTPNPSGCFQNGCADGFECVDFGNSSYAEFCISSSCNCDESFIYQAEWFCTDDCNGGTCIPNNPEPGDICVYEWSAIGMNNPGFINCDGECVDYQLYDDNLDCSDCAIQGDMNSDGLINVIDVVSVVNCILSGASCPCGNMNWDDSVDVIDIVAMVSIILNQND